MANTTLTITLSEAEATRIINAICDEAGVERSGANAKKVVVQLIRSYVEGHERRTIAVAPVEGIS